MPRYTGPHKNVPGRGAAEQPSIPGAVAHEEQGLSIGEQEIEYELPPTKVTVVNLPKPEGKRQKAFRVGVLSIVVNSALPRMLVGERNTRTRLLIKNLGPDPIYYSHESNVTRVSGFPLDDTDPPLEMQEVTMPVYVTVDDVLVNNAKVAIHEEFEIPVKG